MTRTYRDHLEPRPHFPLPFAGRVQPYAVRQQEKREAAEMQRRVEGSRL